MSKRPLIMCLASVTGFALILTALAAQETQTDKNDPYTQKRHAMVEDIEEGGFGREAIDDEAVLDAMRTVPRHKLVPAGSAIKPIATVRCPSATAKPYLNHTSSPT